MVGWRRGWSKMLESLGLQAGAGASQLRAAKTEAILKAADCEPHSCRNAIMGSIREALCAGT